MMQGEMQKVKILLIFSGTKSGAVTLPDFSDASPPDRAWSRIVTVDEPLEAILLGRLGALG